MEVLRNRTPASTPISIDASALARRREDVPAGAAIRYSRDDWRFILNLKNLTGKECDTRGFGSFSVIPGLPLSAYLSIGYLL